MAKLGCPCGNVLWNGCDGDETEYDFVPFETCRKYYDTRSMFWFTNEEGNVNMWKCDMCDRFMVFDTEPHVTRWMKRICVDDLPDALSEEPCVEGYIFNNLLLNAADYHFEWELKKAGKPTDEMLDDEYETPRRMEEEVFSGKNGRFRDWWYCRNYADYIVFYGEREMKTPLKAWMRYEQVRDSEV